MEILNYSTDTPYTKPVRNPFLGRKQNRFNGRGTPSFTDHASLGAKGALQGVKGAFILSGRILLCALKFIWLVPAVFACVYFPYRAVEKLAYQESFANPVNLGTDNDWALEFLDNAISAFAMDNGAYFDVFGNVIDDDGTMVIPAVTFKQPVTFKNYTVRNNDTISGISYKFGLSKIDTIIAVNGISNVTMLMVGQKLKIPSMDGLFHEVGKNDTLQKIGAKYNVSVNDLLDVNDLSSETLSIGQKIFIPGARLDSETLERAMGEVFYYPIRAKWWLSSPFGWRKDPISGVRKQHTGIDMACPTGTPIYASMSGTVAFTGYNSVYGNYVIIKHRDNYQTLYAHMSKIVAKNGTRVAQGEKIGLVGSTGYSTGPHLHFTVYKNGKLVDPKSVVKR